MRASEDAGAADAGPANSVPDSPRLAEARLRSAARVRRQRDLLRPLGVAMIVVVVAGATAVAPRPGLQGVGLAVALLLIAFAACLLLAIGDAFLDRGAVFQAADITLLAASSAALVGLQPQGAAELACGAAVWIAVTRLPLTAGVTVGVATIAAAAAAAAHAGTAPLAILAATLVLALLGFVAYFIKESRASQDRTELLLAELEDARDEQARAAAVAERGRIAGELHDVLAHSLSGAAIQLQAARMLADRDSADMRLQAAIDRASHLVKDGLANARQAVGALRGEALPGVAQLETLVAGFRDDLQADVTLRIEGSERILPSDAGLALYRAAQEALTNVARYAPGAATSVVLRYSADRATLCVEDTVPQTAGSPGDGGLAGVGGGNGLAGLRERVERVGGSLRVGPTDTGWRVEVSVPA